MAKKQPEKKEEPLKEWFFDRSLYTKQVKYVENDRHSIIAEIDRGKGQTAWIKFSRKLESWEVRVEASVSLDGEKWYRYHTGIMVTDPLIEFWEFLSMKATGAWRNDADAVYLEIHRRMGVC